MRGRCQGVVDYELFEHLINGKHRFVIREHRTGRVGASRNYFKALKIGCCRGKSCKPPARRNYPGWTTLGRGYERLLVLEEGWKLARPEVLVRDVLRSQ